MEPRPFANILSQNEWINYILSYAFSTRQSWKATDVHALAKYINAFPVNADHSYTFRVMKNLGAKGLLQTSKTWRDRPVLMYRLTDAGNTHFYTGDQAVQKQVMATIAHLKQFVSDLEKSIPGGHSTHEERALPGGYIGLRHYYEWLLLQGAKQGNSPAQLLSAVNPYGKSIKKSYFYQVYSELQPALIVNQQLTHNGQIYLENLEQTLLLEIQKIKPLIDKMTNLPRYIKQWIKAKEEND